MNHEYRSKLRTMNTRVYYEPGIQYNRNLEYRSKLGTWNTGVY